MTTGQQHDVTRTVDEDRAVATITMAFSGGLATDVADAAQDLSSAHD